MGQDIITAARGFLTILLQVGIIGAAGPAFAAAYKFYQERGSDTLVKYLALLFCVLGIHILGLIPILTPLPKPLPQSVTIMLIADLILLGIGISPAALTIIFPRERSQSPESQPTKYGPPIYPRSKRILLSLIGFGQITVALTTLVGYATGYRLLYQWSEWVIGMAPNTAVCFLLSGIGFLAVSLAKVK